MNKIIIALIGVMVVAGGVYAYSSNQKVDMMAEQKMMEEEKMMMEKKAMEEKAKMEKEAMMKDDEAVAMPAAEADMMDKKAPEGAPAEASMMKMGTYEAYSADKLARAATGDVVLFFRASWCPSCRGLNASIEGNLKAIPEGVSILKLDYDKETELKKKYVVTTQHTLVQVDKDGTLIKKWSGSASVEALVAQIQ